MIIACIISFIIGALVMMCAIGLVACQKDKKPRNKVRFYVARNWNGKLNVFLNKPLRNETHKIWMQYSFIPNEVSLKWQWVATRIVEDEFFKHLGLKIEDYKYLKWENEPVEVFLNLED